MNRARTDGGLLHLELDIDPDVYPELHAALSGLHSEASRGERLRLLAAAGLVWEKLRIRGQAALHGMASDPLPPPPLAAASSVGAVPASPQARQSVDRSAAARTTGAAPMPSATPAPPVPPGFVDLALDALPSPAAPQAGPPTLSTLASGAPVEPAPDVLPPPVAARWPPVLIDVVDPATFVSASPLARREERRPRVLPREPDVTPGAVGSDAAKAGTKPQPPADLTEVAPPPARGDTGPTPEAPLHKHEVPVGARSSTRSRLQRMKEKGLFKNG